MAAAGGRSTGTGGPGRVSHVSDERLAAVIDTVLQTAVDEPALTRERLLAESGLDWELGAPAEDRRSLLPHALRTEQLTG